MNIVNDVFLIHNESFMLHIFDEPQKELAEFDAYLTYEFENNMSKQVEPSNKKIIPHACQGALPSTRKPFQTSNDYARLP